MNKTETRYLGNRADVIAAAAEDYRSKRPDLATALTQLADLAGVVVDLTGVVAELAGIVTGPKGYAEQVRALRQDVQALASIRLRALKSSG